MEIRMVLSGVGVHTPAAQVLAARVAQLDAQAARQAPSHSPTLHTAAREHHHAKHAHAAHHHAADAGHHAGKSKTKSNSPLSNFFNSIFGGGL
jgi:hypothetical protein